MPTLNRILAALIGLRKALGYTSTAFVPSRADGFVDKPLLFFTRDERFPAGAEERPFRFRD